MAHKTKYKDHGTLQTSNEEVLLISAATRKILNIPVFFSPLKNTSKLYANRCCTYAATAPPERLLKKGRNIMRMQSKNINAEQ
jgi:hypothetical protein